jgi:hypothetical protein
MAHKRLACKTLQGLCLGCVWVNCRTSPRANHLRSFYLLAGARMGTYASINNPNWGWYMTLALSHYIRFLGLDYQIQQKPRPWHPGIARLKNLAALCLGRRFRIFNPWVCICTTFLFKRELELSLSHRDSYSKRWLWQKVQFTWP